MAVKRLCGKKDRRSLKCLSCNSPINANLKDDEKYTCPECGQVHLVDIYGSRVALTVAECEDIRHRHKDAKEEKAIIAARKALLARAQQRQAYAQYLEWLEELVTHEEDYIKKELELMGNEMAASVTEYLNENGFNVSIGENSKYIVKRVKREAV